jgi:peptidoglycan-associated lipoprotein
MKVWKQKLAAAVLAGMLLGAGCTEELDPRPPSAELTEEELLEIQENAAAAEEIAKKADAAAERVRSIGADEATAEIVQRAQEKAETAEAKVNSATNRAERQEAKRSLTAAEDAIKQAEDALAKAEQNSVVDQEELKRSLTKDAQAAVEEARALAEETQIMVEQAPADKMAETERLQEQSEIIADKAEEARRRAAIAEARLRKAEERLKNAQTPEERAAAERELAAAQLEYDRAKELLAEAEEEINQLEEQVVSMRGDLQPSGEKATPETRRYELLPAPAETESDRIQDLNVVYFDFDQSSIRSEFETQLRDNFRWLQQNPGIKIQLEGHCDERGTNEYNLALGERRARAVLSYMIDRLGADPDRFTIVSFGEERPAQMGKSEESWSLNRRVEFTRL